MKRGEPLLRRPAWIGGTVTFLLFEMLGAVTAFGLASLRCCGAGGRAGPRDAGEWVALVLLVIALFLLGLALAACVSLMVEGVHRLADRRRRRRDGPTQKFAGGGDG